MSDITSTWEAQCQSGQQTSPCAQGQPYRPVMVAGPVGRASDLQAVPSCYAHRCRLCPLAVKRACTTCPGSFAHDESQCSAGSHSPLAPADEQDKGLEAKELVWLVDLASRCAAAIRLWPQLPADRAEAAACTAWVVSCLEPGILRSYPQLQIQSAQALSRPDVRANMCAVLQRHSLTKRLAMIPSNACATPTSRIQASGSIVVIYRPPAAKV